jgi:anti-sigma-K factor RskA
LFGNAPYGGAGDHRTRLLWRAFAHPNRPEAFVADHDGQKPNPPRDDAAAAILESLRMNPEEREELASLYVLGLLEGDELAAFERILATDPELVALVGELENASTILAMSVPQQRTPEALRDSVLSRIKQEDQTSVPLPAPQVLPEPARRPAFSFSWVPWAIAAGLTVASALLWNERSRLSTANGELEKENQSLSARVANLDEERARLETRLSTLESEKNELQIRVASLEGRDPLGAIQPVMLLAQPGAPPGAEVMAVWDLHRREGCLHLSGLPKPAPDKDYQLWIITPEAKQPLDAGLVSADKNGVPFSARQPLDRIAALAISLEPKGGSVTPQGPVIYLGKL